MPYQHFISYFIDRICSCNVYETSAFENAKQPCFIKNIQTLVPWFFYTLTKTNLFGVFLWRRECLPSLTSPEKFFLSFCALMDHPWPSIHCAYALSVATTAHVHLLQRMVVINLTFSLSNPRHFLFSISIYTSLLNQSRVTLSLFHRRVYFLLWQRILKLRT